MRASTTFLAASVAALAAASPVPQATTDGHSFDVTNFVFGCTTGCYWNFDVSIEGSSVNHPAIDTPVHCEGGLDENTDYVDCGFVSETQSISAYIVKATNELKLKYYVNPQDGSYYNYYGSTTVYSATGDDADKQEPSFKVPESSATGVA